MSLTLEQVTHYETHGWVAPVEVMTEAEATSLLSQLERAEANFPDALNAENRNNAHLEFPFLAKVACHPAIVEAARDLVGPDLTLWSTVLFIKEPDSSAFVSWHQDAFYMGLEPSNFVTAWLAFTPSTIESGCVSVIPGTHGDRADHVDTFGQDNILTRGQQVSGIDPEAAVHLELRPGQMSLHHPWLVHGSQPNRSAGRRVGMAMQSYLGGDVRPLQGEHHVMHIAGQPVPAHFVAAPRPNVDSAPSSNVARRAANQAFANVLYDGAEQRRAL